MNAEREGERDAGEPAVDSDAVELPADVASESAAPPPPLPLPPSPERSSTRPAAPPPAPAASVAPPAVPGSPPPIAAGATSAGPDAGASGAASPEQMIDDLKVLASERPELVVGAAFAGGILAAMILRRLGN